MEREYIGGVIAHKVGPPLIDGCVKIGRAVLLPPTFLLSLLSS